MKNQFKKIIFALFFFLGILMPLFNRVLAQSISGYNVPVYSWIWHTYSDPDVEKSGSLLSEPFQEKGNNLPGIIFLSRFKIFSENASKKIKELFLIKDSLISFDNFSKALKRAEKEKMISLDSSVFSNKQIHVLGILYLNGVYTNRDGSLMYIDHSYSASKGKSIFSAFVEIYYKNKKWNMGKTVVYDMSN